MVSLRAFKIMMLVFGITAAGWAGSHGPNLLLLETEDVYGISFGATIEAYQGQENALIPIRISNEHPIEYIHLTLQYDASMIDPILAAPAFFVQYFEYDLSVTGRISIDLECDLMTPPVVPPIPVGDTIFAYILCDVMGNNWDRDVVTQLSFYEDPNTPFPDNFLMRDNGYFIVPPQLTLTSGMIYIYRPLYGDINLNSVPYEIGDVISFINYLNGSIDFTPRQYANSDCNRDGIPATISDLIYMINVINGETELLGHKMPLPVELRYAINELKLLPENPVKTVDNQYNLHIFITVTEPLGGFVMAIKTPDVVPRLGEVVLDSGYDNANVFSSSSEGEIRVVAFAADDVISQVSQIELTISIDADYQLHRSDFSIERVEFSGIEGNRINADYRLEFESPGEQALDIDEKESSPVKIEAYPNPFNSRVIISLALSRPEYVIAEIFDILGRKVRTLEDGYVASAATQLIWDGKNEQGESVTTGMYFCKVKSQTMQQVVKIQYLK
jgi:hypothetical protein